MRVFVVAMLLLLLPVPGFASDGVIEINQAAALAGGITPGDVPGFPVWITTPGSYVLTGNLSVPGGTTGISIRVANVTLDLGGFTIAGPNVCSGYPTTTCTYADFAAGIADSFSPTALTIRNGLVTGMSGYGIYLTGASSSIDNVRALGNGATGIQVGGASHVTRCISVGNLYSGIVLGNGGTAEFNEVRANGTAGIVTSSLLPARVVANVSYSNASFGITANAGSLLSGNVSYGNGTTNITGGRSTGDNICGTSLC